MNLLYSNKKKILILVLIVSSAFISRSILLRENVDEPTYTIQRKNLVDEIQVSGNYQLGLQKKITSTSTGIITELFVKNGDSVEEGDELFKVESTATEEEKASALSAYQTALANLNTARSNLRAKEAAVDNVYDQIQGNEDTETFAQRDLRTTAEAARDNAYYSLTSAQAAFQKAELDYKATQDITIDAPVSGTIANLLKKVGDSVKSQQGTGTNATPAETIMYIADVDNPHLLVTINESYLPRIRQTLPVEIIFDAIPKESFKGSIEMFETISENQQGIVSYKARLRVNDPNQKLLSGMTAVANIETYRKDNAITVPNSAIITSEEKIYLMSKEGKMIEVETGYEGIAETEIISGVSEGDVILINPENK